jgi:hypothetical protein
MKEDPSWAEVASGLVHKRSFRVTAQRPVLQQMSEQEMRTIGECLRAVSQGPFFDDAELILLTGLTRAAVQKVASAWPDVDDSDGWVTRTIGSALWTLGCYPHHQEKLWPKHISVARTEVARLHDHYYRLKARGTDSRTAAGLD